MYTTICTYHIVPGSGSELKQRIQAEVEPLISSLPGFVGYYLLEVSADQVVSVSIFDSKGKADIASGPIGFWMHRLSSALGDCILGLPEIVSGQTEVYRSVEARSRIVPTTITWRDIITKTIVISPISRRVSAR